MLLLIKAAPEKQVQARLPDVCGAERAPDVSVDLGRPMMLAKLALALRRKSWCLGAVALTRVADSGILSNRGLLPDSQLGTQRSAMAPAIGLLRLGRLCMGLGIQTTGAPISEDKSELGP